MAALNAAFDDVGGPGSQSPHHLLCTSTDDLHLQHAEARDSLELACMCLSISRDNPSVNAFQQTFMGSHTDGLFQEIYQLECALLHRGGKPLDLARSTGIVLH